MKFKGDIIITDPCYIIREDKDNDWELCRYGGEMGKLGIKNYICRDTLYGDWSCSVYDDLDKKIGDFCADSGQVAVFLLDEVLKYNSDFNYHLKKKWTTTLIKDFDGEVIFKVDDGNVHVIGKGNINFSSFQTGF